jgi:hypothetical protein
VSPDLESFSSTSSSMAGGAGGAPGAIDAERIKKRLSVNAASIALPTGLAALGAALLSRERRSSAAGLAAVSVSAGALLARWQLRRAFTWQPSYLVEARYGRLEIRRYAPQLRARTVIESQPWASALAEGFSRLAGYVAGGNELEQRIPMTAPVLLSVPASPPRRHDDRVADSPSVAELYDLLGFRTREMAFVMPERFTLYDLPRPKDRRVVLHSVPAQRVATLRFHGRYAGDLPAQKRNELLFLTKCAGLRPKADVWFAGYDAPLTLPLLRRNEVLVELED